MELARSISKVTRYLCAVLFIVLVAPATAQPVRSPIPPESEIARIDGFGFPRKLAGLQRNGKTDYGTSDLGFSVSYGVPRETWADIYIYDRGLDLPSGPAPTLAKKELEAAIGDVNASLKAGSYQKVVLNGQSTAGSFARAFLTITQGGTARRSVILVSVRAGKFIKIRLTSTGDANRIAQSFAAEYERVLSRPTKERAL